MIEGLRQIVDHCSEAVPLYQERLAVRDHQTMPSFLEWFRAVPLLDRTELLEAPESLVDPSVIPARYTCTGGTTSSPIFLQRSSLEIELAETAIATGLSASGVREGTSCAVVLPFGLWNIGHLCMRAIERLGARSIPIGTMASADAIADTLRRFKPDSLLTHPALFSSIEASLSASGVDPSDLGIGAIFWAGEAFSDHQRALAEAQWGALVFSLYGCEELDGIACERPGANGLVPFADANFIEIVSLKDHSRPAGPGETGLLVVTTLLPRRMPLIRYMTGDLAVRTGGAADAIHFSLRGRASEALTLSDATKIYTADIETALRTCGIQDDIWQARLLRQPGQPFADILEINLPVREGARNEDTLAARLSKTFSSTLDLGSDLDARKLIIRVLYKDLETFEYTQKRKLRRLIQQEE